VEQGNSENSLSVNMCWRPHFLCISDPRQTTGWWGKTCIAIFYLFWGETGSVFWIVFIT